MILVHKTFTEITPESAEDGDSSDSGMVWENVEYTFKELVRLLRDYPEASNYPTNGSTGEWYETGYFTECYATGTERCEAVHYSADNAARSAKYWRKAAQQAGLVK